jgi:hypothetical protein
MFLEVKKHPGILNEQLEEFADNFLINLNLVQKAWFKRGEFYQYQHKFFKTENLARAEAEGMANQKVLHASELKFRTVFEEEKQKIRKVEIDCIRLIIVGSKEDVHLSLYFPNQENAEFQRIKRILAEQTCQ